jgi:class 3 adenylate cyclase/putative methionine-R-sulfoxide reductase with GAF domain
MAMLNSAVPGDLVGAAMSSHGAGDTAKTVGDATPNAELIAQLRDEAQRANEQVAATSAVLRVISASPGDLQPVFEAILANAMRLCDAELGNIWTYDGRHYHVQSMRGAPPALAADWSKGPPAFGPDTGLGRLAATKQTVHIPDVTADRAYATRDPMRVATADTLGARTFLAVPMLKDGELVGAIVIYRKQIRPFSDKQIELVQTFAAQAVIAIENARLLNELRQSLEQQTATSEVLGIISSSPGELDPVFDAVLANATRICDAKFGVMFKYVDGLFHTIAMLGVPSEFAKNLSNPRAPTRLGALGRITATKQAHHSIDVRAEDAYIEGDVQRRATADLGGARTMVTVPMLKENELVGAMGIYRQELRPFTEKQIALVQNFAAQAVIAIENARLLNELRERTGELERSYGTVREQASQLEVQSHELKQLNQQLEQRVAEQVGEIERMSRLRRFLPPQVADLIVTSGAEKQLESHRREITALFCDLRGFTGFSESSDPEDVMTLLHEYHGAIGKIIHAYGGTLERFAGDGIMVIFNDPVPLPNPALQAVNMALAMRAALGSLMEKWRRMGHDLGFGIGISHGYATLGTIGFEGRFDYAAIGTVANVASRLCDEAKPGQILITPRVLIAVEDAVTIEPAGDFELKGIRRPMTAYNVLAAIPAKS